MTSANGARAILAAVERADMDLRTTRWAAIGTATSASLERAGLVVEFVPSEANSLAMATELPVRDGDRVLVVRGDLAGPDLARRLEERGAVVDDAVAYRTAEAPASSRTLLRTALGESAIDAVVFTSGSTIRGLRSLAAADDVVVTASQPSASAPRPPMRRRRPGFTLLAVASSHDADALARTTADALHLQPQETS